MQLLLDIFILVYSASLKEFGSDKKKLKMKKYFHFCLNSMDLLDHTA